MMMKRFLLLCICYYRKQCARTIFAFLAENTPARNIGPGGMSGRVTTIDVVLSNPDVIYAGTASGGGGNPPVVVSTGFPFLTIRLPLQ